MSEFQVAAKIEGGDKLLKELADLGGTVRSTARAAIRAGAKVMQAQAEQNAEALATRAGKHTQINVKSLARGTIQARVGPSKRRWYFKFFEEGVTGHEITGHPLVFEGDSGLVVIGGVNHPGMAARPWLRPAFDEKQAEAVKAVEQTLREAIEQRRAILAGEDEEEE